MPPETLTVSRTPRTLANLFLFGRTLLLVAAIRAALTLLPFRITRRLVTRFAARRPFHGPIRSALTPDKLRWAVQAAARRVPAATCLTQSLALHILLHRQGHPSRLQIGVARSPGQPLRAHAWIESENRILIGALPDLAAFAPLPTVPL